MRVFLGAVLLCFLASCGPVAWAAAPCLNDLQCYRDMDPQWVEIHGNGVYTTAQKDQASRRLAAIEKDMKKGDPAAMAERANMAMRGIFKIAVLNLRRHGHYLDANEVERGWKGLDGELQRIVKAGGRNIGDFGPWSEKLAILYLIIETKLGYQLCYTLRLTDIATFLYTPEVVFHPCKYGRTEFGLHFIGDDPKYRPFFSTTVYWVSNITCSIATFGAGTFFICSPISMLVEMGAENVVAPKLGEFIYDKACN